MLSNSAANFAIKHQAPPVYPSRDFQFQNDNYVRSQQRKPVMHQGGLVHDILQNRKQIGATLIGAGMILSFMGIMLLFERNLLRFGNMAIVTGVPFLVGFETVKQFFLRQDRIRGSAITLIGIFLVFLGRPRLGIVMEIFGILNLFGNMFPVLLAVGKGIPVLGEAIGVVETLVGSVFNKFSSVNPYSKGFDDKRPPPPRRYDTPNSGYSPRF